MSNIKILVDSGSDISPQDCEKYNIDVVPLSIQWPDGRSITDYFDFDGAKYCEEIKSCQEIPKTAQPSPYTFVEKFTQYENDYDDIFVITMSAKGSGTFNSATIAKKIYQDDQGKANIHLIDSKLTSLAIVIIAIQCANLIEQGLTADAVEADLQIFIEKVYAFYLVEDISYLIKGGRVSSVKGLLIATMKIKPIISIKGGEGYNYSNALGQKKGIAKMVDIFMEKSADKSKIFISHANCIDKVESYITALKKQLPDIQCYVYQTIGTMSTHAGPGTFGIFFD